MFTIANRRMRRPRLNSQGQRPCVSKAQGPWAYSVWGGLRLVMNESTHAIRRWPGPATARLGIAIAAVIVLNAMFAPGPGRAGRRSRLHLR